MPSRVPAESFYPLPLSFFGAGGGRLHRDARMRPGARLPFGRRSASGAGRVLSFRKRRVQTRLREPSVSDAFRVRSDHVRLQMPSRRLHGPSIRFGCDGMRLRLPGRGVYGRKGSRCGHLSMSLPLPVDRLLRNVPYHQQRQPELRDVRERLSLAASLPQWKVRLSVRFDPLQRRLCGFKGRCAPLRPMRTGLSCRTILLRRHLQKPAGGSQQLRSVRERLFGRQDLSKRRVRLSFGEDLLRRRVPGFAKRSQSLRTMRKDLLRRQDVPERRVHLPVRLDRLRRRLREHEDGR